MADTNFANYEEASREYLRQFHAMLDAPPMVEAATARGGAGIAADFLMDRADAIADVSKAVTDLSREHMESADLGRREDTGVQLMSQAAAELNLAASVIEAAASQAQPQAAAARAASQQIFALRDAVNKMVHAMEAPVHTTGRGAGPAAASADPVGNLRKSVSRTVGAIVDQVVEVGGDIVVDLVQNTEWNAVITGVSLLNKNVGDVIQKIKEGVGAILKRALGVVQKLILNVYDKILALFGKGVEDQARQQVRQWIEKLKQEQGSLSKELLNSFYGVNSFQKALDEWLPGTQAGASAMDSTAGQVDALAARFLTFAGHAADVESGVVMAKSAGKFVPQLLPIIAGIQVTLLAAVTYSGFDYIGYKRPPFIAIVKGTAQVVHENLGFPI